MQFAGFWKRFVAAVIDFTIILIIYLLITSLAYGDIDPNDMSGFSLFFVHNLLLPLVALTYYTLLECSRLRGSFGKLLLGIQVVDAKGKQLSFWRAFFRTFSKVGTSLTFGLGFFIAAWTKKKQGLHDFLSGSVLVSK